MDNLKVALLQADLVWHNPEKNRLNLSEKINQITEKVDVIVLPEMFTTGFTMQPESVAETMQGETLDWMLNIAKTKKSAMVGSVVIIENENYYNRLLFVHPSGKIEYYDKRHLFTLAGEDKVYTKGTKKIVINYKGWKICPLICYDLRFPVWARNTENYDVLLFVANWPKKRIFAWDALLKARAIENMCFVAGVNRVGVDFNNFEYSGHSVAYNYLGEKLTNSKPDEEDVIIVQFSKKEQNEVRKKLGFLNDKDEFTLQF